MIRLFFIFIFPSALFGQFITNHTTSVQGNVLNIYVNTHFYSDGGADNAYVDSTWVKRTNGDLTVGFTFGMKDTVASVLGISSRTDTFSVDSNLIGLHRLIVSTYHLYDTFQNPYNGQYTYDTLRHIDSDTSYFQILNNPVHQLNSKISLYPNPGHGFVQLSGLEAGEKVSVSIVDGTGKLVRQQKVMPADPRVSLVGLKPGIYLLRIKTKEGHSSKNILVE